jgi:hypothetical protein
MLRRLRFYRAANKIINTQSNGNCWIVTTWQNLGTIEPVLRIGGGKYFTSGICRADNWQIEDRSTTATDRTDVRDDRSHRDWCPSPSCRTGRGHATAPNCCQRQGKFDLSELDQLDPLIARRSPQSHLDKGSALTLSTDGPGNLVGIPTCDSSVWHAHDFAVA